MNDGHPADENVFSNFLKKLSGKSKHEEDVTEEEIKGMVNEGHEQGVLKENEAEMINNIFEFGEKQASDVMIHRKAIVALDCEMTITEAFNMIMEENFSRYPVYKGDIDNIVGVFHIRDLVKAFVNDEFKNKTLLEMKDEVLFDAYYIPETRNISLLFKEMQSRKVHMSIVVDEYGQTSGIITLEDILEEIVGNIMDEYDEEEDMIKTTGDNTYVMDGQTDLEDVEDFLDIKFDAREIDTLNGYMIYRLGKIPDDNEEFFVDYEGYRFKIINVENKMIKNIEVSKIKKTETEEESGNE